MSVNEFIKQLQKTFGEDLTYKATSKDGIVFKSKGWDDYEIQSNKTQSK
jgi:hypothetical protein